MHILHRHTNIYWNLVPRTIIMETNLAHNEYIIGLLIIHGFKK